MNYSLWKFTVMIWYVNDFHVIYGDLHSADQFDLQHEMYT